MAGRVRGLSLDRMRELCSVLGDPQADQATVHVTGTNGKGSTARMVTALLGAHDLTVGTYTSPHLQRVNERISRNGEPITDRELAEVLSDLARIESMLSAPPSYFELLTAGALRWFSDAAVQAAVVEVGLLGRWDATNVVDGVVAVITNVGRDHTDGEGDWRRRIAEEKAGIVKPGATLVLGEPEPRLRDVFAGTPAGQVWVAGEDFAVEAHRLAVGGQVVSLRTPGGRYDDIVLPLHGAHQAANAALAVAAAEAFFDRPLAGDLVAGALASVRLPGRFELVRRHPLVILDGAHNVDGAVAATRTLAAEFRPAGRLVLVAGMLAGRDPAELLAALGAAGAREVVCCTPDSPRAVPAAELAAAVRALGGTARVVDDVAGAVAVALEHADATDVVLVTGSLYTVGAARRALGVDGDRPGSPSAGLPGAGSPDGNGAA